VITSKVAVIGTGYVGAVTSTCLAWLGHDVWGLDNDAARVESLRKAQVPFYEPGLAEMLREVLLAGRVHFTADRAEAFSGAEIVFLCVGTPLTQSGRPDLSQLESAVHKLSSQLQHGTVVVNKSTVPVGSGNWLRTMLEDEPLTKPRPSLHVVSNPEFLREGSAIEDFLYPDRIVLGGDPEGVERVVEIYEPVLQQAFASGRLDALPALIRTDLASAEMIKYAANAFLATKISFANEISNICELVGADAREVLPAIGADRRIGRQFLSPGLGWGGSCFAKDVAALIETGSEYGYRAALLRAAVDVNGGQRASVIRRLQADLKVLKGRRIALLGLSFKPGTDDLRDAPAIDLAWRLLSSGAVLSAYDPVVRSLPGDLGAVRLGDDVYDAASGADAVVVATDWPEFRDLKPELLRDVMRGVLVLDARNILPVDAFTDSGLQLRGFGW